MKQVIQKPSDTKEKTGEGVKVNKELDKLKGKVLFPKKTEAMNNIVSALE